MNAHASLTLDSPERAMSLFAEDDVLSDEDFTRLADLIMSQVGIRMPSTKRLALEGRLRKRLRSLDIDRIADYCRHLFDHNGLATELVHLIDVVTTNKTDFFREVEHFHFLRNEIMPTLLANRRAEREPLVKVWSAACSTGAEAYTIAMLLDDIRRRNLGLKSFKFFILGTDISTRVVKEAEHAIYPIDMVSPVPEEMSRRYLMWGREEGSRRVRIVPELRRHARFERLNLMDRQYPVDRDVDIIFLRNVLIYFDKETQASVVERIARHVRPGGYLILAHSESMIGSAVGLPQVAPGVFRNA